MDDLGIKIANTWDVECWHRKELQWHEHVKNLVVADGLNTLLLAALKTGSALPTWYISLIDAASFTGFNFNDAMVSHPGWFESLGYSEANRQLWQTGPVAAGYIDNAAARANFNISVAHNVRGGFLTSSNVKGGTGGTLFGEAQFSSIRPANIGDILVIKLAAQVTSS